MNLADVNVLVEAFRSDAPRHRACRKWLDDAFDRRAPFAVSRLVLSAVVRITTSQRFYQSPSSLDEAFGFCADILAQPNCRLVEPGDGHWRIFERLCLETQTRGPMVTDAWFAALAMEWDCEWITLDRDFGRFPGLRWRTP
ncbi:VapC toxin family PIN domain ribonuclease [Methylocystis sp. MitZ-2018]|nr:VapC toxin family PIN domain ribonuclease [Methylocystis sp. MitZ-2018]